MNNNQGGVRIRIAKENNNDESLKKW